jgi:D-glycero-D-manno-heptose 1,7-bisphosphate phosphatase
LILLDRDGVLNRIIVNAEQGTIDSPLAVDQVEIFPYVPGALAKLCSAGYRLAIVTNQPAWAKGKTTQENLEKVHARVVEGVQTAGARIASSHICFHRSEDGCSCRKPKTGLLEDAFRQAGEKPGEDSWMIGDGVMDLQAGKALGLRTAFVARQKADVMRLLDEYGVQPTLWVDNIDDFANQLIASEKGEKNG